MANVELIFAWVEENIPWAVKGINFKFYNELTSNLKAGDHIEGSFRVTTLYNDPSSWWGYDFNPVIPELISHYLRLNLTFIEPTSELNITSQKDIVNGALELMRHDKIDYIIDETYLSSEIFHPDITSLSTGIHGLHSISILTSG